jgi:hypothetical protein
MRVLASRKGETRFLIKVLQISKLSKSDKTGMTKLRHYCLKKNFVAEG